ALSILSTHILVLRRGPMTVGGPPAGVGQSRLTGWRLDGGAPDASGNSGTIVGTIHGAGEPMRLQWISPHQLVRALAEDYVVPVTLVVETRFPDGHLASYSIASSFSVTVNFAAQSG